ncbi:MAG: hypothetical protein WCF01_11565 [Nitrososphaeraceae archaeon]
MGLISVTGLEPTYAALDMDVKCAIYRHSDDLNGDNVDVRILVMGLKGKTDYTAEVIPDHNPNTTATTKTDSEGIFWIVIKVLNGEYSLLFKVNVYEGNGTDGKVVAIGDDDAPCTPIYRISEQVK